MAGSNHLSSPLQRYPTIRSSLTCSELTPRSRPGKDHRQPDDRQPVEKDGHRRTGKDGQLHRLSPSDLWKSDAKLKGSIGEGPNHSNFSDQSSVRIQESSAKKTNNSEMFNIS